MSVNTLPAVPEQALRNSDIPSLINVLRARRNQKVDVVMPTNNLRMRGGNLEVAGLDDVEIPEVPASMNENGVTPAVPGFTFNPSGLYSPTGVVDQHLSSMFDIPVRYLRKLRTQDVELLDTTINRHADRATGSNLVRLIWGSLAGRDDLTGIVRAVLSDRYAIIDHLDTVMSILAGLKEANLDASNIRGIDLSDNRLYLNIEVPEIAVHGRSLIQGYRSPFTGQTGEELPMVHAGLKFTNSEIGRGAFEILPYAMFEVCSNGATINAFKMRKVHLGRQLDQGEIKWSQATLNAANELVRNQVRDAVGQFLTTDFLEKVVTGWEAEAGIEVAKPVDVLTVISKELSYTEAEQDLILADFIKGGQTTAFGIGHAVTSAAQRIDDPDRANELQESHLAAVAIAAREAVAA